MYDAAAVLGKAWDFKRKRFPAHMYESLHVAAGLYQTGQCPGGIAVCGAAEMKALERGMQPPVTEAAEMRRYLIEELHIPAEVIYVDDTSTNTPDNFINLRKIAEAQRWKNVVMPMATRRIPRAQFLGAKICHGLLQFTMVGVLASDDPLATEEKLLGDMVCTLKGMKWGDAAYIAEQGGWNALRMKHRRCQWYRPTDSCEPYINFHPKRLMEMHGVMH